MSKQDVSKPRLTICQMHRYFSGHVVGGCMKNKLNIFFKEYVGLNYYHCTLVVISLQGNVLKIYRHFNAWRSYGSNEYNKYTMVFVSLHKAVR